MLYGIFTKVRWKLSYLRKCLWLKCSFIDNMYLDDSSLQTLTFYLVLFETEIFNVAVCIQSSRKINSFK